MNDAEAAAARRPGPPATVESKVMQVEGATVFITGANRGIGLAFARQALAFGVAKVYAGMRTTAGFRAPGHTPVPHDLTAQASVDAAARQAGDTTILVNNAGIAAVVADPLDDRVEDLSRKLFEVNYYGVIRVTKAFAPVLGRSAQSAVINVLSTASWGPIATLTPYAISKSAAWGYTNHARLALKAQNTAVLGLHVGFVDTDLTRGLDIPKADPGDVARQTLEALEARAFKASLSADIPIYVDPAQAL